MQSKIKFDLTEQNDPCIILEISQNTDDLRDKVAQRFIEELGYESNLLNITFLPGDGKKAIILPINELDIEHKNLVDIDELAAEFLQEEIQEELNNSGHGHLICVIRRTKDSDPEFKYEGLLYNPTYMHWKDGYYIVSSKLNTIVSELREYINEERTNPKIKKD